MKKLASFPRYWLDLAQIWCKGVFLDSKSKINNKSFIRRHSEGKIPIYRLQKMHITSL